MSEEFSYLRYAAEVFDEMVRYHLGEFLFYGSIGLGAYAWGEYKSLKALHAGHFSGPTAVIQTTRYDPAVRELNRPGEYFLLMNPETGNGFRDQKIRTEGLPIRLGDMFDKSVSKKLVKYFNKAAEGCRLDSPVVYEHLPHAIPAHDRDKIMELIQNSIQNYFSGMFREPRESVANNLGPTEFVEEKTILPLLVREEGAVGWQLRFLLLELNAKGELELPDPRDVRYLMKDGSYKHDLTSVEKDRYQVLRTIAERFRTDPVFKKSMEGFGVAIPTGRIISFDPEKRLSADLPALRA